MAVENSKLSALSGNFPELRSTTFLEAAHVADQSRGINAQTRCPSCGQFWKAILAAELPMESAEALYLPVPLCSHRCWSWEYSLMRSCHSSLRPRICFLENPLPCPPSFPISQPCFILQITEHIWAYCIFLCLCSSSRLYVSSMKARTLWCSLLRP